MYDTYLPNYLTISVPEEIVCPNNYLVYVPN